MQESSSSLCAAYSHKRDAWCVYRRESSVGMVFLWRCHTQKAAEKLAREVNSGTAICRGSKELGTACGQCIKCELTGDGGC